MTVVQIRLDRDVVCVQGTDAEKYLHSQLSNDVQGMAVGSSRWSLLLEPTGKLIAVVRVTRFEDTVFMLDTEPGVGDDVVARLNRFRIRVAATVERLDWQCVALRGEGARVVAPLRPASDGRIVDAWWPEGADAAVDLIGASVADVESVAPVDAAAYDALRVSAGWPIMGVDFAQGCIPAETGLVGIAVSFSKGCYPGQELVERMDSRATNAPFSLRVVDDAGYAVGDQPFEGATVTSVGGGRAIVRVRRGAGDA